MVKVEIPSKVCIGNIQCPIIEAELETKFGDFDRTTQVIRYGDDIKGKDILRIAILHEVIHAMEMSNTSIGYLSEAQVDNIALSIMSLLKDNKDLVKWVQQNV